MTTTRLMRRPCNEDHIDRHSERRGSRPGQALIEKLMSSKDPADQARMVAQACLTEAYERSRWPRRAPPLPDLLTYLMDQHGLSRADLIPVLGTASRVSEVLTGKRGLSMTMVRKLRERFHVPADLVIPPLDRSKSLRDGTATNCIRHVSWHDKPVYQLQRPASNHSVLHGTPCLVARSGVSRTTVFHR